MERVAGSPSSQIHERANENGPAVVWQGRANNDCERSPYIACNMPWPDGVFIDSQLPLATYFQWCAS